MVSLELSKVVSSFLNRCFSRELYSGPIGSLPSEESDEFFLAYYALLYICIAATFRKMIL